MADSDYAAGLRGETIGHDTFSYSYQLGVQERERQARGGSGGGIGSAMAGVGGGNILMVAILVIVAFCAFMISFCIYPIAGITTLIAFLIGSSYFNSGAGMNGVGLVFADDVTDFGMKDLGADGVGSSPEALDRFWHQEIDRYRKIVETSGIRLEVN